MECHMDFFNHAMFGYATTPEDTMNIIHETGCFYIMIGICYLFAFIIMRYQSEDIQKKKIYHLCSIVFWILSGFFVIKGIILTPIFIFIFSIYTLWLNNFMFNHLMKIVSKHINISMVDNEKLKKILERAKFDIGSLSTFPFLNDRILWLMILFKSLVATRAILGLF